MFRPLVPLLVLLFAAGCTPAAWSPQAAKSAAPKIVGARKVADDEIVWNRPDAVVRATASAKELDAIMRGGSEVAVGEVRAALQRDNVVVLAIFTPHIPATAEGWDGLEQLRKRLPHGVTVVGVSEEEAAGKIVEQDEAERDQLPEDGAPDPIVPKATIPFILVMDSEGVVRHVQTDYRAEHDVADVARVVRSVRQMSDMR
jgi:hypothetical protein